MCDEAEQSTYVHQLTLTCPKIIATLIVKDFEVKIHHFSFCDRRPNCPVPGILKGLSTPDRPVQKSPGKNDKVELGSGSAKKLLEGLSDLISKFQEQN